MESLEWQIDAVHEIHILAQAQRHALDNWTWSSSSVVEKETELLLLSDHLPELRGPAAAGHDSVTPTTTSTTCSFQAAMVFKAVRQGKALRGRLTA